MTSRSCVLAVLGLAGACRSAAVTPEPPPLRLSRDAYVGSVHTGPIAGPAEAREFSASDAWWFDLEYAYLPATAPPEGEPISAITRQVFVESDEETVQTHSVLATGVTRLRGLDRSLDSSLLSTQTSPVWPGTTALWSARPNSDAPKAPRMRWHALEVEVSRAQPAEESVSVALVLEGAVDPRDRPTSDAPRARVQREHLVLESSGDPLTIFFPAPCDDAPFGGYAVELRRALAPRGDALERAIESSHARLSRSSERARANATASAATDVVLENASAMRALESRSSRRPALVFLSQACGAPLTGDLAVDADAGALENYLSLLRRRAPLEAREPKELGWLLESTSYAWLAARAADDDAPLELELQALLLVHAGALARFPDLLADAVRECTELEELEARLVEENRTFLEDADPAARLRAFEWLRARGEDLGDFEPLAPLAERRTALQNARKESP